MFNKNKLIVIAGEITANAEIDYSGIVYHVLEELGYEDINRIELIVEVSNQSTDIALELIRMAGIKESCMVMQVMKQKN